MAAKRSLVFSGQALRVMRVRHAITGRISQKERLIFEVQRTALAMGDQITASRHLRLVAAKTDSTRRVRIWYSVERKRVTIFAIEASRDGGKTFFNPL